MVRPAGSGHCSPLPASEQEPSVFSAGTSAGGILPLRLAPLIESATSCVKPLDAIASSVPVNGVPVKVMLVRFRGKAGSVPLRPQFCTLSVSSAGKADAGGRAPYRLGAPWMVSCCSAGRFHPLGMATAGTVTYEYEAATDEPPLIKLVSDREVRLGRFHAGTCSCTMDENDRLVRTLEMKFGKDPLNVTYMPLPAIDTEVSAGSDANTSIVPFIKPPLSVNNCSRVSCAMEAGSVPDRLSYWKLRASSQRRLPSVAGSVPESPT